MNDFKKSIRILVRRIGFDIVRYHPKSHPLARRRRILDSYNVNLVLDVGANVGQFARELRDIGYSGKIISFEPLGSAYDALIEKAKRDDLWETYNYALGDKAETAFINIAENSYSSSLLNILPSHVKFEPRSKYIGKENIQIKTLDSIFSSLTDGNDNVYLKIDTQGFEKKVIGGAQASLRNIDTIQMEMSLVPLYKDELLFYEMYHSLLKMGYQLIAVEPGFTDKKTGELLQVDGIFHRMQANDSA